MSWTTGSGEKINFFEILQIIKKHHGEKGLVFVGTDSFRQSNRCTFVTSIVLLSGANQRGGRYFILKEIFKQTPSFYNRILKEVEKSINIALKITEICPNVDLEIHLDVSSEEKDEKTSSLATMLRGYAMGSGFKCKLKPYSFAASSVADKHSK